MRAMAEAVNVSGKLVVQPVIVGFEDTSGYPASFLSDLYRMVQELVHNVVKHAQATQALLELVEHERTISILVEDDGIGINEEIKS